VALRETGICLGQGTRLWIFFSKIIDSWKSAVLAISLQSFQSKRRLHKAHFTCKCPVSKHAVCPQPPLEKGKMGSWVDTPFGCHQWGRRGGMGTQPSNSVDFGKKEHK